MAWVCGQEWARGQRSMERLARRLRLKRLELKARRRLEQRASPSPQTQLKCPLEREWARLLRLERAQQQAWRGLERQAQRGLERARRGLERASSSSSAFWAQRRIVGPASTRKSVHWRDMWRKKESDQLAWPPLFLEGLDGIDTYPEPHRHKLDPFKYKIRLMVSLKEK